MLRIGCIALLKQHIQSVNVLGMINCRLVLNVLVNRRVVIVANRANRIALAMYLGNRLHGDYIDFFYSSVNFVRYVHDSVVIRIVKTSGSSYKIYHPDFICMESLGSIEYVYKSLVLTKQRCGAWLISKLPFKNILYIVDMDRHKADCMEHHGLALHTLKTIADTGCYPNCVKDLIFEFTTKEELVKQLRIIEDRKQAIDYESGWNYYDDDIPWADT